MTSPEFLAGGGEMGERIRAFPWSDTPLGAPESWPQALKTAARTALTTRHPIFIFWGEQLTCLYNDGYRPSLGPEKHPSILGIPAREAWPEIWDIIGPQIELVMRGDGATWHENRLVPILRHGSIQEVYWTYSYGPIDDATAPNGVGGVLVICTETTAQVLAGRRLAEQRNELARLFTQAPGAIALLSGPNHIYDFANTAYFRLVGNRDIIGRSVAEMLPEVVAQGFVRILDDVFRTGEAYSGTGVPVRLDVRGDGELHERILDFVYQPTRDDNGVVTGIFVEAADVTEVRLLMQEISRREGELRTIADALPITIAMLGNDATYRFVNKVGALAAGRSQEEIVGKHVRDILPADEYQSRAPLLARALAGESLEFDTRHVQPDGGERVYRVRYLPNVGVNGEMDGLFATGEDVTDRRRSEDFQEMLNRELSHRMKNQLAMIQSIVNQTFRIAGDDSRQAHAAINGRIGVLGGAHDLLIANDSNSTNVRDVVTKAVVLHEDRLGDRFRLAGPSVRIDGKVALSLALILHELSTNATKYGSLANDTGSVNIDWQIDDEDERTTFELTWKEQGGPPVVEPAKVSFGSRLIRGGLGAVTSSVVLAFEPDGVRCTIVAELAALQTGAR